MPKRPWLLDPDYQGCQASWPESTPQTTAVILQRVRDRSVHRPLVNLPLVAGWFIIVLVAQLILQPAVARALAPLYAIGLLACVFGWVQFRAGRIGAPLAWKLASFTSSLQAVTFIASYFLTHFGAYESAVVVHVFAVSVLDVRGRAIQFTTGVVLIAWIIGTALTPFGSEAVWNLMVILGACSAGLLGHRITMRTIYVAEWLRTVDEGRTDAVSIAYKQAQHELAQRQRAEAELLAANSQLLQAHKLEAIGQLAAGVAHEINTPTQFVTDNTTFLQSAFGKLLSSVDACRVVVASSTSPEADAARETIKKARLDYHSKQVPRAIEQSLEGLRRIGSLVAALKEFSHPSGGIKDFVELNSTIKTTIEVARNEWKYVAEMVTELDPALPAVWCLRDELNQVVLNLIVNAAHAISEQHADGSRGTITIRTRCAGDQAVIEVSDDGAGIPEAIRHRIFEPFFTTKAVGQGTGQGLAISYQVIVEKHQGTLEVSSVVGSGTTFTIRIPVRAADSLAA